MNKHDFVMNFKRKLKGKDIKVPYDAAEVMYETIFETLAEALMAGEEVLVTNFGKFFVSQRMYRSLETRRKKKGLQIRFVASTNLKKQIKAER